MNAQQLYFDDGEPAGVAYCSACRGVAKTIEAAEACCRPNVCECGAECEKYRTICQACYAAKDAKREADRFAKATKRFIEDAEREYVCLDGDRYLSFDDLDEYCTERLADWIAAGEKPWTWEPPRVYATAEHRPSFSVESLLEWALDESHEDAIDDVPSGAAAELQAFLDTWCAENMPSSYFEDHTVALVPWPPIEPEGSEP